jgi:predicted NBD/HSP70 family sugar kinase
MDNGSRYVGLDVHRDTISVAVCDSRGKLMLERVIPTSAADLPSCSFVSFEVQALAY